MLIRKWNAFVIMASFSVAAIQEALRYIVCEIASVSELKEKQSEASQLQ